eukprot:TRINITY_DN11646_c0_g1_i12.p2 TRINITY_DN11646_c0_g1~~TRINITY_DN11646_c0_g1_i12.p2  ORF type:complete len:108 (-),score=15.20 TRINITY_DN11646_c0_g1_i12:952-1275(-)
MTALTGVVTLRRSSSAATCLSNTCIEDVTQSTMSPLRCSRWTATSTYQAKPSLRKTKESPQPVQDANLNRMDGTGSNGNFTRIVMPEASVYASPPVSSLRYSIHIGW